jgi:ABC-2 type transport system ATP-binding protein
MENLLLLCHLPITPFADYCISTFMKTDSVMSVPALKISNADVKTESVIYVHALTKNYAEVEAVKGIDFQVQAGEVFGLLGPNGAGKTSTVEILEGLRPRTGGQVAVLGFDPDRQKQQLKDRIGVCLQATNLAAKIRVQEALDLFGSFYTRSVSSEKLLQRLQLWEKRAAYYETLSGGQKQRLALALALVNDPQLLFLDEPTTGLDPQIRLEIHSLIQEMRAEKRTVVMTTHYIEEAERLCDRVAIMDEGKIVAMGTPAELQQKSRSQSRIQIVCAEPIVQSWPQWADAIETTLDREGRTLTVYSGRPARTLFEIMRWLDQQNMRIEDVHLKKPTLEDVFVELTGKALRD